MDIFEDFQGFEVQILHLSKLSRLNPLLADIVIIGLVLKVFKLCLLREVSTPL